MFNYFLTVNRYANDCNNRLSIDQARTHSRLLKKALKPELVLQTWMGTLYGESELRASPSPPFPQPAVF